jgi:hypothetical protein
MGFRAVIFAFAAAVAILGMMPMANAQQDSSWNGTWVGNWETGEGTQIVFAGNTFISIYWGGDYVSDAKGSLSKDGKVATITWQGGEAVLTRKSATAIDIVIRAKGKKDVSFALKRDG